MRPDGREPTTLLAVDEVGCALHPQWSPDSRRIVVSVVVDGCEWETTFTGRREVWVVSLPDGSAEPVVAFEHHDPECTNLQIAFSPDGQAIAAVDADCQPRLYRANDGSEIGPLAEFPIWWTNQVYPQWSRYRHLPPYTFFEGFSSPSLNPDRWEPQDGALDRGRVFIEDQQLWVDVQNDGPQTWHMNLPARLEFPVNAIEFVIGLKQAEGSGAGLGINFTSRDGQPVELLLDSEGRLVIDTADEQVALTEPALPVDYLVTLRWEADRVVILVNDEPKRDLPVDGPAPWVSFWASVEPGERLTGFIDEVRLTFKPPSAEKPPPERGGKVAEVCVDSKPPQLCVVNLATGQSEQITRDLDFETIYGLSWSPDGTQIAFDAGKEGRPDHRLYVINADGTGLTRLTQGDFNDITPAWSPDGEWIAVHRNCGLALLRPDGGEPQLLREGAENSCVLGPSWSPDGEWIAFVKTSGAGKATVHIIRRDGQDVRDIDAFGDTPIDFGVTSWSPDGKELAIWYKPLETEKMTGLRVQIETGKKIRPENESTMPWDWFPNVWRP